MGRPKASQSNLRIAEAFANAVTLPASKAIGDHQNNGRIFNVSADAPFSVLAKCIPALIRDSRDRYPVNRDGVTSAEFRKYLIRQAGYVIRRCRTRKKEASCPISKSSGMQWCNRRWVDCNDPSDRSHLKSRIVELLESFPMLVGKLDTAHIARTIAATVESDGLCEFDGPASESSFDSENSEDEERAMCLQSKEESAIGVELKFLPAMSNHSLLSSNISIVCSSRRPVNIAPCPPLSTRCYLRIHPDRWQEARKCFPAVSVLRHSWSCTPPGSPNWAAFVANVHYELGMKACDDPLKHLLIHSYQALLQFLCLYLLISIYKTCTVRAVCIAFHAREEA